MLVLITLVLATLGAVLAEDADQLPYAINCAENAPCAMDLRPWCIVGKPEPVYGHCELQDTVCGGGQVDFTESCLKQE